jgi:hypothetical protein
MLRKWIIHSMYFLSIEVVKGLLNYFLLELKAIEQKGMTFYHYFGYSLSFLKRGKKKRIMKSKNSDQKSYMSARSLKAGYY